MDLFNSLLSNKCETTERQNYDDKLCALVLPTPNNTNITCAHCKHYNYVGGKQTIFYEIL